MSAKTTYPAANISCSALPSANPFTTLPVDGQSQLWEGHGRHRENPQH